MGNGNGKSYTVNLMRGGGLHCKAKNNKKQTVV